MTDREAEIYKIIRDNPMISQNEIAQRLGITRSAVSVYLNNLTKKGILRGRGYLLNDAVYPVIIGPGHIDILSHCEDKLPPAQEAQGFTAAAPPSPTAAPSKMSPTIWRVWNVIPGLFSRLALIFSAPIFCATAVKTGSMWTVPW